MRGGGHVYEYMRVMVGVALMVVGRNVLSWSSLRYAASSSCGHSHD